MLDTPAMIESLKCAGRSQLEMRSLCDEMITQEQIALEFYKDQLADRLKRIEEQSINAQTDYSIKVDHSEKRIALFTSMKDRLSGKDIPLHLPANPLFPPEVEKPKSLFRRKK